MVIAEKASGHSGAWVGVKVVTSLPEMLPPVKTGREAHAHHRQHVSLAGILWKTWVNLFFCSNFLTIVGHGGFWSEHH